MNTTILGLIRAILMPQPFDYPEKRIIRNIYEIEELEEDQK
jgi:hypothetical protein